MASQIVGVHTISRTNHRLHLALESTSPGAFISAELATGRRFEEQWYVETLPNDRVVLRNHRYSERYLSYEGDPSANKLLLSETVPRQWSLRPYKRRPDTFFIVASPDGPEDDAQQELAVEFTPSPPLLVLRPIRSDDPSQTWHFDKPKLSTNSVNSNRAL